MEQIMWIDGVPTIPIVKNKFWVQMQSPARVEMVLPSRPVVTEYILSKVDILPGGPYILNPVISPVIPQIPL